MNHSKQYLTMYFITIFALLIYSYALVDPNITILNHPVWTVFRNVMVQLGYHLRPFSAITYFCVISILTILHLVLTKRFTGNPVRIALITGCILLFSYPFLSRDLFNYMFDAKIVTQYHANPYLHKAMDFPDDQWLRFMHWTHRTYPYGPSFLLLTLIPSFFGFGKLLLNLLFFKTMFVTVYLWTTYILTKTKRSYGLFFATHPVVIIEGLVNNHNDLIAVMFAIMGVYYASSKILSVVSYLASAGIKFITAPAILLAAKMKGLHIPYLVAILLVGIIAYLSYAGEFQQWYVLNFFILIPFLLNVLKRMHIFFYGILLSYIPLILYGEGNTEGNAMMKQSIIVTTVCLNIIWEVVKPTSAIARYFSSRRNNSRQS